MKKALAYFVLTLTALGVLYLLVMLFYTMPPDIRLIMFGVIGFASLIAWSVIYLLFYLEN